MRHAWVGFRRQSLFPGRFLLVGPAVGAFFFGVALAVLPRPPAPSPQVLPPNHLRVISTRESNPAALVDLRDQALGQLLIAPADLEAMDTLVRMQRFLAADRPQALRADAVAHAQAVKAGRETPEHLTLPAMRLLVLANLLAATQIESEGGVRPAGERTSSPALHPAPRALPAAALRSTPAAPRLQATGAANQEGYFLVVFPPVPVEEGQYEVSRLTSAGFAPLLRRFGAGLVQVQLGAFATQANAESLATRARERGLAVSVLRGATGSGFERVRPSALSAPTPAAVVQPLTFSELMRRGGRLYAGGWYGPALASFRQAARQRPDSAPAYLWWGRAALRVNRVREAREALRRAVDLSGDGAAGLQARLLLQMMDAAGAARAVPGTE